MSTQAQTYPTLLDVARRKDPNGKVAVVVEILSRTNEILADMPFFECNDGTGHKTTIRSGIPDATWRMFYQGVQPTKTSTVQVQDACAEQMAYSEVDKSLADLETDKNEFLMSEATGILAGMGENHANAFIYGNAQKNPEQFNGLAPRFNQLSTDITKAGYNIINGGGTGATNTSLWFVGWGKNSVHGIFPRGSKAGIQQINEGEQTHVNTDGSMYPVYRSRYTWNGGLCVRDWRYVVRIANIDVSKLEGGDAANLVTLMTKAYHRIRKFRNSARWAIYANQSVATALDLQVQDRVKAQLSYRDFDGQELLAYRGIPIRTVEAILDTEAAVTANAPAA